jgi:hypothetical protein
MKKLISYTFLFFICISCIEPKNKNNEKNKIEINTLLDKWHKDAAETNFEDYFGVIATDGIFIGTDATENWNKKEFMAFSKPYFDRGKAWNFTSLERNIFFSADGKTAWFDELLDTQMKLCRGSGVLTYQNDEWKIKHYVLSMTIPNEKSNETISLKSSIEDTIIQKKKNIKKSE